MQDFYCEQVLSGKTKVKTIFETEHVLAFHHTKPHWPVHIVVIPKTHIPDIFSLACDDEFLAELFSVIRRVAAYVTKKHGAQDSKHLHWHIAFGPPYGV